MNEKMIKKEYTEVKSGVMNTKKMS